MTVMYCVIACNYLIGPIVSSFKNTIPERLTFGNSGLFETVDHFVHSVACGADIDNVYTRARNNCLSCV